MMQVTVILFEHFPVGHTSNHRDPVFTDRTKSHPARLFFLLFQRCRYQAIDAADIFCLIECCLLYTSDAADDFAVV